MRPMKQLLGACVLIVAFSTRSSRAATLPDTVAVSPSFRALALEMLAFAGTDSMIATMARGASTELVEEMRKSMPGVSDSTASVLREEVVRVFDENHQALNAMVVQLYARHFTEAELRDVLAFYHTPTGGKMIHEMPGIFQETMAASRVWAEHLTPILFERIEKRLSPPAARGKS